MSEARQDEILRQQNLLQKVQKKKDDDTIRNKQEEDIPIRRPKKLDIQQNIRNISSSPSYEEKMYINNTQDRKNVLPNIIKKEEKPQKYVLPKDLYTHPVFQQIQNILNPNLIDASSSKQENMQELPKTRITPEIYNDDNNDNLVQIVTEGDNIQDKSNKNKFYESDNFKTLDYCPQEMSNKDHYFINPDSDSINRLNRMIHDKGSYRRYDNNRIIQEQPLPSQIQSQQILNNNYHKNYGIHPDTIQNTKYLPLHQESQSMATQYHYHYHYYCQNCKCCDTKTNKKNAIYDNEDNSSTMEDKKLIELMTNIQETLQKQVIGQENDTKNTNPNTNEDLNPVAQSSPHSPQTHIEGSIFTGGDTMDQSEQHTDIASMQKSLTRISTANNNTNTNSTKECVDGSICEDDTQQSPKKAKSTDEETPTANPNTKTPSPS